MKSAHSPITAFLEDIKRRDFNKYQIVIQLRDMVLEVFPNVSERFKYGGILFSLHNDFGGLFVYKKHVSFEFSYEYKLTSAFKLEGSGKYRRHLKIISIDENFEHNIKVLLRQIESMDKEYK